MQTVQLPPVYVCMYLHTYIGRIAKNLMFALTWNMHIWIAIDRIKDKENLIMQTFV